MAVAGGISMTATEIGFSLICVFVGGYTLGYCTAYWQMVRRMFGLEK